MAETGLKIEHKGGVTRLALDRPKVHNAFDDRLIAALTQALVAAGADEGCRAVLLTGEGRSFSAGADLGWMRRMAGYDLNANFDDARALARLMHVLDECPKPVVAAVNGAAIGGGVGLVAAADVAISAENAVFQLSETRLGIVPAVIAPFVLRAIGERQARRLFLTAERFSAARALELGLVHETVPAAFLRARAEEVVAGLLANGPKALASAKRLCRDLRNLEGDVAEHTARLIAELRASNEGQEGIRAFLDKRPPAWRGGA